MDQPRAGHRDPAVPPEATGRLRLTIQPTLLGRGAFRPRVTIDGEPVPTVWGENVIAVHAGRHRVEAWMDVVVSYGRVAADVVVPAGGEARLWYAPPIARFIAGRMGVIPQAAPGSRFATMFVVAIVVGLLVTFLGD